MKLWEKGIPTQKIIEEFTIGKDADLDLLLAEFDVLGNIAHAKMLESAGLLETDELEALQRELKNIYREIQSGKFNIAGGVEDIHSQIELLLTQRAGDAGKKIHAGRSRNDQILLDLRLFIRGEIQKVVFDTKTLFDILISLSEAHKNALLPGYTHLQIAMPSSFGLWFSAYAESLVDDLSFLQAAFRIVNKNPLGSAAGYGSSFPLNRQMTTDWLGFDSLNYNVVYTQMGRGKTERIVSMALSTLAATLGKFAMDVCLYMNQNFGFITFPAELTTGSSIMPHKKNPDVFELIRAKCNKLQALPNEISLITANLPSGYHRDMQIIKEQFLPAFAEINAVLKMMAFMLPQVIVKEDILDDDKYSYLFSVDAVNELVKNGVPFRDAYKTVAHQIEAGEFQPPKDVNHTHEGSIGNLCNEQIQAEMGEIIKGFEFDRIKKSIDELLK